MSSPNNAGLMALEEFGCHPAFVELIDRALGNTLVHSRQAGGRGEFCIVAASPQDESALYVDQSRLHIALSPESGQQIVAVTGVDVAEKNDTTWRLRVKPEDLADEQRRQRLADAVVESVKRSAGRALGSGRRGEPATAMPRRPSCPVCHVELNALGSCDDHGTP